MSAIFETTGPPVTEERRVLVEAVPWERYERLAACFGDTRTVRLTYIDGSLEIMSPIGAEHERIKSNLGVLLETYLDVAGIRWYRRGGFTLTQPGRAAGEPDESYCIGADKTVPDLVIEVVVSSDALSKLPLYRDKGVAEVWIWEQDRLVIHCLAGGAYSVSPRSKLLPGLDVVHLVRLVGMRDQYDAVRAFREALRAG
ncbi:Uma2 family endonuclease [Thiohalocapsa halophila]|nr:Uma2 family endonuclease [Thiohalocapsa halophila]